VVPEKGAVEPAGSGVVNAFVSARSGWGERVGQIGTKGRLSIRWNYRKPANSSFALNPLQVHASRGLVRARRKNMKIFAEKAANDQVRRLLKSQRSIFFGPSFIFR
jgi:hypothetical protein